MKFVFALFVLFIGFVSFSQEEIVGFPDVAPEFPGGKKEMERFNQDNFRHPKVATQNDVFFRFYVEVVVEKDGSLTDVRMKRGIGEPYDAEAIRVVKSMPKWKPALVKGKPVRCSETIAVVISNIEEKEETVYIDVPQLESSERYDSIVEFPEVRAEFPGGVQGLYKYINENLQYPKEAIESKKQGRVYIRFIVETDGTNSNIEIRRGVSKSIDKEALRLIRNMPKWTPGMSKGKSVRTYVRLPIAFSL